MALNAPQKAQQRTGPFEVLGRLAVTDLRAVYKARHPEMGRLVAIKITGTEVKKNPVLLNMSVPCICPECSYRSHGADGPAGQSVLCARCRPACPNEKAEHRLTLTLILVVATGCAALLSAGRSTSGTV